MSDKPTFVEFEAALREAKDEISKLIYGWPKERDGLRAELKECEITIEKLDEACDNLLKQRREFREELEDLRRVNAKAIEALKSIIELGKRDMSSSKYDGYFYTARNALREYKRQVEVKIDE